MAKLSIFFLLCSLSMVLGNYYYYPSAQAGALSYYPYQAYGYGGYGAPYAVVAAEPDCDKKEEGSSSSESSSEESSSSSESSEEGEKKEEGESKEGEKEEGEEKKEGEEKEEGSSSSSSSSEESSEEGEKKEEKKEKKEKKEEKEEKSLFPPRTTYVFPPAQQMVYAQPTYSYMPYKTYPVIQSAPVRSAYVAAPYAGKGYSPMTRIISTAPAARIVSAPAALPVAKSYSGYPSYGVYGMSGYLGSNIGYLKA